MSQEGARLICDRYSQFCSAAAFCPAILPATKHPVIYPAFQAKRLCTLGLPGGQRRAGVTPARLPCAATSAVINGDTVLEIAWAIAASKSAYRTVTARVRTPLNYFVLSLAMIVLAEPSASGTSD